MNEFLTLEMMKDFVVFVQVVFTMTQFFKDIVKFLPTKYLSTIISFGMLLILNFAPDLVINVILMFSTSIMIAMSANGQHNFDKKVEK